jgi:hypothetical protein
MTGHFHVSSALNRRSITAHGLDWTRMGLARGIAGSPRPEQDGCFLCLDESEVEWFLEMNNTGGPVDVWAVDGVSSEDLVESPEGHFYLPAVIPPEYLTLVRTDVQPLSGD